MNQAEFDHLLARLADDREVAGVAYNALRRRLVNLLRLRGHSAPEEAADRAFDITAAKLVAGEPIGDVGAYLCGVVKMLSLEDHRKRTRHDNARRHLPPGPDPTPPPDPHALMKLCFAKLLMDDRHFLWRYYSGDTAEERQRNRLKMMEEMCTTLNALRLRAHRLRLHLRGCLHARRME